MNALMFTILSGDPFSGFREGFANVILGIFGLILMVSLAVTITHVIQGERESAKKMFKWIIVGAVGFVLIAVIKGI